MLSHLTSHKPILYTVPEVQCFDLVSANGVIMVRWTFIHTGGLNLIGMSGMYSYIDGSSTVTQPITLSNLDTTSVNVSGLVAGFVYTFSIIAENKWAVALLGWGLSRSIG